MDKLCGKIKFPDGICTLHADWKTIITKAWSIRFLILAIVCQAGEIIVPLYSENLPRHVFALLSISFASLSFYARIIAQKDL